MTYSYGTTRDAVVDGQRHDKRIPFPELQQEIKRKGLSTDADDQYFDLDDIKKRLNRIGMTTAIG